MKTQHVLALIGVVCLSHTACGGAKNDGEMKPAEAPQTNSADAQAAPTTPSTTAPTAATSATHTQGSAGSAPSGPSAPTSGEGQRSVESGRRREDIQAIIVARRDTARACYDQALKNHPGIEGDIDIKWTIDPKGNVTDASVDEAKSQIHDAALGQCLISIVRSVKFAESSKGFETRSHYPFNFHPRGPAAVNNSKTP